MMVRTWLAIVAVTAGVVILVWLNSCKPAERLCPHGQRPSEVFWRECLAANARRGDVNELCEATAAEGGLCERKDNHK
jgi:hypothetical protein